MSSRSDTGIYTLTLKRQQTLKKRAITTQDETQIFRGRFICQVHMSFKLGTPIRKDSCQALHDLGNQLIRLLDSQSRVIDKTYLNGIQRERKCLATSGKKSAASYPLHSSLVVSLVSR